MAFQIVPEKTAERMAPDLIHTVMGPEVLEPLYLCYVSLSRQAIAHLVLFRTPGGEIVSYYNI